MKYDSIMYFSTIEDAKSVEDKDKGDSLRAIACYNDIGNIYGSMRVAIMVSPDFGDNDYQSQRLGTILELHNLTCMYNSFTDVDDAVEWVRGESDGVISTGARAIAGWDCRALTRYLTREKYPSSDYGINSISENHPNKPHWCSDFTVDGTTGMINVSKSHMQSAASRFIHSNLPYVSRVVYGISITDPETDLHAIVNRVVLDNIVTRSINLG